MSAASNFLVGVYDDDDVILSACAKIRGAGVKIHEVYSPFPIHGIDPVLGYGRSRLNVAAFMFGITGTTIAFTMQSIMLGFDWKMNIGGKPHIAVPSFVPVTFELTILMACLGMVFTFLVASGLGPGARKLILDPRYSDDKFILAIDLDKNSKISRDELVNLLKTTGASEVSQKEVA
jgi:hypothetical protein